MGCLQSSIAGSWYPGNGVELREMLDRYAAEIPPVPADAVVPNILILPHAGYVYSARTAMYGIARLRNAAFRRVVILAPSHRSCFRDRLVAPEAEALGTPFGDIPLDTAAIMRVGERFPVSRNNLLHTGEHAAQIEYPLLQYMLHDFQIAPFVVGEFSEAGLKRAAAALREILDESTLLVVSSDFTHYGDRFGFAPFQGDDAPERVRQLDFAAFEAIRELDCSKFTALLDRTGATICGRNPIRLMLHCVPDSTQFEMLHYATSIAETGDSADFVSYLCAAARAQWRVPEEGEFLREHDKITLLNMARRSIEYTLKSGRILDEEAFSGETDEAMRTVMGCFVTLNRRSDGALRGCIGEIEPCRPLYQAVTARAIDAAFRDPRFRPLSPSEWGDVRIEISALTPPRPVNSWREIEIGRHGMTLSRDGHMAVFLPQVAPEQGWNLETTLTHLALKAGLKSDAWREGATFTVFEAIVFHEA